MVVCDQFHYRNFWFWQGNLLNHATFQNHFMFNEMDQRFQTKMLSDTVDPDVHGKPGINFMLICSPNVDPSQLQNGITMVRFRFCLSGDNFVVVFLEIKKCTVYDLVTSRQDRQRCRRRSSSLRTLRGAT